MYTEPEDVYVSNLAAAAPLIIGENSLGSSLNRLPSLSQELLGLSELVVREELVPLIRDQKVSSMEATQQDTSEEASSQGLAGLGRDIGMGNDGHPRRLDDTGLEIFGVELLHLEWRTLTLILAFCAPAEGRVDLPRIFSPSLISSLTVMFAPLMPPTRGHSPSYSTAKATTLAKS